MIAKKIYRIGPLKSNRIPKANSFLSHKNLAMVIKNISLSSKAIISRSATLPITFLNEMKSSFKVL
jgi:hypothetical protein